MILYNLKTESLSTDLTPTWRITKFDVDLNPESSYIVSEVACECPQGHKPKCRHRTMLPLMQERADTAWFFCYDNRQWYDPTGAFAPADLEDVEADENGLEIEGEGDEPTDDEAIRESLALPEGVTVIGLDDPLELHNAIADAVDPTERIDRSVAGEGPGPSTLAADKLTTSPSQAQPDLRGEPAPCTCPEDWQGMDHTAGCKSRAQHGAQKALSFGERYGQPAPLKRRI